MNSTTLLFPHQLFNNNQALRGQQVYLLETDLFFNQYRFHKQKIAFHRASMQAFKASIESVVSELIYIDAQSPCAKIDYLIDHLARQNINKILLYPLHDDYLTQQIEESCDLHKISIKQLSNPIFLNTVDEMRSFFTDNDTFFHHHFYQQQRCKHHLLMEDDKPQGGSWSYDKDNRKNYPHNKKPPSVNKLEWTDYHEQALAYTREHYEDNYGHILTQNMP